MIHKIISLKDLIDNEFLTEYPNTVITINFDVQGVSALLRNKIFICEKLIFENINNNKYQFKFYDCTFNCDVEFINSTLNKISFNNTKYIKSLEINNLKLDTFNFSNNINTEKPILHTNFSIKNNIISTLIFMKIEHTEGKFVFVGNRLGEIQGSAIFKNSIITNILFRKNSFLKYTKFENIEFKSPERDIDQCRSASEFPGFYKNNFVKVSFSQSKFTNTCQFENCDFFSTTWFENCENLDNSKLRFVACEFKGFSLFNKSKINLLDIDRCTFNKSSSFADAEFNTLKLFEVKFNGGAYFDEMKINKVINKSYLKDKSTISEWKKTLRAIKQESQKTENKIDFNNYRNYELAAHYKELKLLENFKDTSILWSTRWSSNFGNWFWAFGFTIISGLFFYSILYRIENSSIFNFEKTNDFFVGAFRFFLVTDFFNPLENDRTYLENGWSWLIFILGKIFIAFGIYEMIQSFRKFKA